MARIRPTRLPSPGTRPQTKPSAVPKTRADSSGSSDASSIQELQAAAIACLAGAVADLLAAGDDGFELRQHLLVAQQVADELGHDPRFLWRADEVRVLEAFQIVGIRDHLVEGSSQLFLLPGGGCRRGYHEPAHVAELRGQRHHITR